MKCIICFESKTGVTPDDYFVQSKKGHLFHNCCVKQMIRSNPLCPVCDEDLRQQYLVRVNSYGDQAPPVPPKPNPTKTTTFGSSSLQTSNGLQIASYSNDGATRVWNNPNPEFRSPFLSQSSLFSVKPDYAFKIVILGNYGVGKSSLLQRYADERFDPRLGATVGCDLRVKVIQIAGKTIRLNLWDTAGQERHKAVVDVYLRKADAVILCFDVSNLESFLALPDWYMFAERSLPRDVIKIIVGTKSDLWNQQCAVRLEQIQNLSAFWNCEFILSSAKDAINVEVVFRSLAAWILEKQLPSTVSIPTSALSRASAPSLKALQKESTIQLHKNLKRQRKKECCSV